MSAPTGTITFLFTDIEGSTRLWEEYPETMQRALARHDRLLQAVAAQYQGYVFKTVGDAFCIAFATAPEALGAALDAQCALLREPWPPEAVLRVRIALHTGEAESRAGDYFGQSLNRVTRLLAAAHGSQVLLSHTTSALVQDELPPAVSLRDLGQHQLKDLIQPEQIYQLQHPELPHTFPALRSLSTHPNNLPSQLTRFIGREKELGELKALLGTTRLLCLIGPGGSGKTRLSLQVAAETLELYPGGVWLVELAALTDPTFVPHAVAEELGIREQPEVPLTQTLLLALKDKRQLLILDNCEHVLEATAALVATLVRACPHLSVLASSREALGVHGESLYRVPSLSLPEPAQTYTAEALTHFEAVRLFVDRAVAAKEDFQVTNASAPALASICLRLDGIPLAIELAAARVRALSLEQLEERLRDRFRLLTGGARTALPRQQTLRALIDWSYNLIGDSEKLLLQSLSVFAGGWTLEAAEQICAPDIGASWEVLDLLTSLVDKSLVVYEERRGLARYHLLETIRQYAQECLQQRESASPVHERHRDFYLALARDAEPQLSGPQQAHWIHLLDREHDNLRRALELSLSQPATVPLGQELAGALWKFWWIRGYLVEGREWYHRALTLPGGEAQSAARARALHGAGTLAGVQADYPTATRNNQQSLEIWRALGDKKGMAASLNNLGNTAFFQGNDTEAKPLFEESLALRRELGDLSGISVSLNNLGNIAHQRRDFTTARHYHEESLAIKRALGDHSGAASSLVNLGNIAQFQDDRATARTCYQQSLSTRHEMGDRFNMIVCLESLANLARGEEHFSHAALLWGVAARLKEEIGAAVPPSLQDSHQFHLAQTREQLGDATFTQLFDEGYALRLEEAIARALAN